jgi:hypothetical protein
MPAGTEWGAQEEGSSAAYLHFASTRAGASPHSGKERNESDPDPHPVHRANVHTTGQRVTRRCQEHTKKNVRGTHKQHSCRRRRAAQVAPHASPIPTQNTAPSMHTTADSMLQEFKELGGVGSRDPQTECGSCVSEDKKKARKHDMGEAAANSPHVDGTRVCTTRQTATSRFTTACTQRTHARIDVSAGRFAETCGPLVDSHVAHSVWGPQDSYEGPFLTG